MKVDTQRTDARAEQRRQQGRRDAADENEARRFHQRLLRHRQEEERSPPERSGPFELMAALRVREEEAGASAVAAPAVAPHSVVAETCSDSLPSVDAEVAQTQMEDSLRMDTIARAAVEAGVQAGMAQDSGEYQVELSSALFMRTRLRVRMDENRVVDVRCESDSASEREWFGRHREALATRMAGLTGCTVHLDIVDAEP